MDKNEKIFYATPDRLQPLPPSGTLYLKSEIENPID